MSKKTFKFFLLNLSFIGVVVAGHATPVYALTATEVPTVTTGSVTSITDTSATLGGSVRPNEYLAQVAFIYGTTNTGVCNSTLGPRTSPFSEFPKGNTTVSYSKSITGLTPGTKYFFCAVGTNSLINASSGVNDSSGVIKFFTTTGTAQAGGNVEGGNGTDDVEGGNGAGGSGCDPGKLCNPLGATGTVKDLLFKVIDVILVFLLPVIILYIMYAGFLFVTARGESEQISKARSALMWAVIGGVIVLGAKLVTEIIQGTIDTF